MNMSDEWVRIEMAINLKKGIMENGFTEMQQKFRSMLRFRVFFFHVTWFTWKNEFLCYVFVYSEIVVVF